MLYHTYLFTASLVGDMDIDHDITEPILEE